MDREAWQATVHGVAKSDRTEHASTQYSIIHVYHVLFISLMAQMVESTCNVGDLASIPGLGRSPGEGNGKPLQYSCLEKSMDRGAWQATAHGVAELNMTERLTCHFSSFFIHLSADGHLSCFYILPEVLVLPSYHSELKASGSSPDHPGCPPSPPTSISSPSQASPVPDSISLTCLLIHYHMAP